MARLAVLDAQAQGFATSFVVVSDNDLHFHRFDDVYRKVLTELGTSVVPARGTGRCRRPLDRAGRGGPHRGRGGRRGPRVRRHGAKRLEEDIASLTGGQAPEDFVRVLRGHLRAEAAGQRRGRWRAALVALRQRQRRRLGQAAAGIKGDITSRDALDYLRGHPRDREGRRLQGAGHRDRRGRDDPANAHGRRGKSLNGIRQIVDAAGSLPGMLWVFTGTPEFFDIPRGVKGLQPLHDRIQFLSQGGFASPRQAQLELVPFDRDRLKDVRSSCASCSPPPIGQLDQQISPGYVEQLVADVPTGFKGDVGVVRASSSAARRRARSGRGGHGL